MILDRLELAERYIALHPGFSAAFDFLRRSDFGRMELGRHVVDGERLFALVGRDAGRGRAGAPLEAHRRYMDIQYVAEGSDTMGWRALGECQRVRQPHDAARDLAFFDDAPATWFEVPEGSFTVFFPTDAHAPLAGDGHPHKVVMKVAVDWDA